MADANFGWLAPEAKRHILSFLRALAPQAPEVEHALESRFRECGFADDQVACLRCVVPTAAARCRTVEPFLRRVERSGPGLARAGLRPEDVAAALTDFEALAACRFPGRFQPAREQLQSAILFTVYRSFYELREGEVRRLEAIARRAEERERHRIGRELHDEAGQSLLLLRLQLEMLEREAPAALARRVGQARASVETIIGELRRLVAALSPAVLERLGLYAALRHLAARFRKTAPATVRVQIAPRAAVLPTETQEVIYRVAQEGLQNAAKHSHATRINLSLDAADMCVRLRLTDNGAGFDTETAGRQATSFGLAGMRQRAELLGGSLVVRSAPGKGTVLLLKVPAPLGVGGNDKNSNPHRGRPYAVPAGHPEPAGRRA